MRDLSIRIRVSFHFECTIVEIYVSICLSLELSIFESFCNLGEFEFDRFRVANILIEYRIES